MDKAPERYLKQLRRSLVCSREDRERLMADAGDMLENFAQENPRAFYRDYVASFGTPEDFAAEMLSSLDPEDIAEVRTRRRRALLGAVTAVGVLLVLLVGFWFGRQSRDRPTAETPTHTEEAAPTPPVEPSAQPSEGNPEESGLPGPGEDCAAYLDRVCPADSGEITHREAAATLIKLGIMSVNEEGEFHPGDTVTRAGAARIITLIMSGGRDPDSGGKAEPSFSDIQGHWAEAYIEYCFDLGLVFDGGDGCFYPNDQLTGLELVRMALCMVGYDADAYRLRGDDWAVRVDELARIMDPSFYEGLEVAVMALPVTRDDMAQILYNALHAVTKRVAPIQMVDGTVSWQYIDGTKSDGSPTDVLWDRFGMNWEDVSFD